MDDDDDYFLIDCISIASDDGGSDSDSSESEEECWDLSSAKSWSSLDKKNAAPSRFPFSGTPGMKTAVQNVMDPLEYFNLFFDENLIYDIIEETNKSADFFLNNSKLKEHSRAIQWKPLTPDEFRCFLALLVLQSIIQKPRQSWFWTKNVLIQTPFFPRILSERRFSLIMKFLHLEENESEDKLKSIRIVVDSLNKKFSNVYMPERDITVDVSSMAYRSHLSWTQFIPSQRSRFGIKYFALCECSSGYVWKFIIYTGKDTCFDSEYENFGLSTKSMMSLVKPLLNQGYCLVTDNFYTSPELAELLVQNKTDIYGTVKKHKKNMPVQFLNSKLKRGEIMTLQKGKILALHWRDKKDIFLLSTIHNADQIAVTKRNKVQIKPQVVHDYNHTMGGVNKYDQRLAYYSSTLRGQKKYYQKAIRHFLDIVISNAFVLYKKNNGEKDHLDFRLLLVERIIQEHHCIEEKKFHVKSATCGNLLRLTERHFPDYVAPTPCKRNPRRRCVVCGSKRSTDGKRVRKETRFECRSCDVGLCIDPCFEIYHTKDQF